MRVTHEDPEAEVAILWGPEIGFCCLRSCLGGLVGSGCGLVFAGQASEDGFAAESVIGEIGGCGWRGFGLAGVELRQGWVGPDGVVVREVRVLTRGEDVVC